MSSLTIFGPVIRRTCVKEASADIGAAGDAYGDRGGAFRAPPAPSRCHLRADAPTRVVLCSRYKPHAGRRSLAMWPERQDRRRFHIPVFLRFAARSRRVSHGMVCALHCSRKGTGYLFATRGFEVIVNANSDKNEPQTVAAPSQTASLRSRGSACRDSPGCGGVVRRSRRDQPSSARSRRMGRCSFGWTGAGTRRAD